LGHVNTTVISWGIATVISVVIALWLFLPKALPG
jgi:hypothetical protein